MSKKIKELKERGVELYKFTAEDGKFCVLQKPTRKIYSAAISASNGGQDPLEMAAVLILKCWVDGDKEFKDNDKPEYLMGVAEKIDVLINTMAASVEKL